MIARGSRKWFVHWADKPQIAQYEGDAKSLAAFWLEMSSRNPYDHHILISQSQDGGATWSSPFMPYDTRIPAFFGLCHLVPLSADRMLAVWTDGRDTKIEIPHLQRVMPKMGGRMTLQSIEFDRQGNLYNPTTLDDQLSELSPFDVCATAQGAVVVYRNATDELIKDISIIRQVKGTWTAPTIVYEDNWKVSHTTLEGPAVDALENQLAIAWYSAPEEVPQVKVMFSSDGGKNFSSPILIDEEAPLGKVDIAFQNENQAVICWVKQQENGTFLMTAQLSRRGAVEHQQIIAEFSEDNAAGFPSLARTPQGMLLTWKESGDAFAPLHSVLLQ